MTTEAYAVKLHYRLRRHICGDCRWQVSIHVVPELGLRPRLLLLSARPTILVDDPETGAAVSFRAPTTMDSTPIYR